MCLHSISIVRYAFVAVNMEFYLHLIHFCNQSNDFLMSRGIRSSLPAQYIYEVLRLTRFSFLPWRSDNVHTRCSLQNRSSLSLRHTMPHKRSVGFVCALRQRTIIGDFLSTHSPLFFLPNGFHYATIGSLIY